MPILHKLAVPGRSRILAGTAARLRASSPPIILVGMHRSGTSLLARLLEQSGVRMGVEQSRSKTESLFFRDLNSGLLDLIGSSWRCTEHLPDHDELTRTSSWMVERIERQLRTGLVRRHLGLSSALRILAGQGLRWGWKDPRTSLLLPVWSRVFPDAILVHIYRSGLDVALSLMVRDAKRWGGDVRTPTERQLQRFAADLRLWELHLERIEQGRHLFPFAYTLKYEDLLANPGDELGRFFDAVAVVPDKGLDLASAIDPTRANRSRHTELGWLRELEIDSPLLTRLGYG